MSADDYRAAAGWDYDGLAGECVCRTSWDGGCLGAVLENDRSARVDRRDSMPIGGDNCLRELWLRTRSRSNNRAGNVCRTVNDEML